MYKNIGLIRNLFLYLAINLLINLGNTELCDECITPNPENKKGWCVQAKYCPMIGNIVGLPLSRFPTEYQIFIKNSKCSSDASHNYCCALGLINPKFFEERKTFCKTKFTYQTSTLSLPTTTTMVFKDPNISNRGTNTVDLDNHPNLKLLMENKHCGLPGDDDGDKIAYGKMTYIDEFPFMALLQYDKDRKDVFGCGGTLINKNYVLTAAHCILPSLFSVRLGEHDIDKDRDCETGGVSPRCNEPIQDIPIGEIHQAKWDPKTKINDIALIRLKRPVDATANNIGFVCLPTTTELRKKKIPMANIAGWGQTEKGALSKILLKGTVNVNKERQKCVDTYKKAFGVNINDNLLCAIGTRGANTTDTCPGDSGGPLLARSVIPGEANERIFQYGIVASGPAIHCGQVYDIGGAIYTNVSTHMKWILDNIRP